MLYMPILDCEKCGKARKHYFIRKERRTFVCDQDRASMSPSEAKDMFAKGELDLHMYRCLTCGHERGWGNEAVEDGSDKN